MSHLRTALPLLAFVALPPLFGVACGSKNDAAKPPNDEAPVFALQPKSPWPKFRANAQQDGHSDQKPSSLAPRSGVFWSFKTAKGIFSSPVIGADGTIYLGSADRSFYALGKDGKVRFQVPTGEIIDSSALLDDKGRVYFGSGDGKLRALDAATGSVVWTTTADDPKVNKAFINWFEGNVSIDRKGRLWVPNDDFFLYGVDRDDGTIVERRKMPDQTWSLPAFDAKSGRMIVGNNNLLAALGQNVFAWEEDGSQSWDSSTLGTIAASFMLTPEGLAVVGGFDGYVHAWDGATGEERWSFATRDHVYASPARLPDGGIVQASTDGTVYVLEPKDGKLRWTFDVHEPVRSSPAIDGDGNIYLGGGDGRLWVLKSDGTLKFCVKLITEARNDLNASPALGLDAVYLAGESGDIFSVPYDWCLRDDQKGTPACAPPPASTDGAKLRYTTALGAVLESAPESIEANAPIALSLVVREGGNPRLAVLDAKSITASATPAVDLDVAVSGDGKFVVVTPKGAYPAGLLTLEVKGNYLVDLDRDGLRLSKGVVGGTVQTKLSLKVKDAVAAGTLALPHDGAAATAFELSRLALPLPTILPSYNQIGFDSLHYVIGLVEGDAKKGVAFMAGGARKEGSDVTTLDPATKALMPLSYTFEGGRLTLLNSDGLVVEVMNATIPFRSFRIAATLGAELSALDDAQLTGSTVCAQVPFYGPFLQNLGLCNPQTDVLSVLGGAKLTPWKATPAQLEATFALDAAEVSATVTTSTSSPGKNVKASEHVVSLLLVDATTGAPVSLDYGLKTTRDVDAGGNVAKVHVPVTGKTLPSTMRAYLMVDVSPAATGSLTTAH